MSCHMSAGCHPPLHPCLVRPQNANFFISSNMSKKPSILSVGLPPTDPRVRAQVDPAIVLKGIEEATRRMHQDGFAGFECIA